MIDWLIERGFSITHQIEERKSITGLVDTSEACGIYVLHFANDEYYVGLAKNVTKRYVQHRQTYADIQHISFKPVPLEQLKRVESDEIEFFKTRVRLRNIDEMEDLIMERDFDKLVDVEFARRFLADLHYNDYTGDKYRNEELQSNYKYRQNFQLLTEQSFYDKLLALCRLYIQNCLPAPLKTEYAFWSVTCFRVKAETPVIRLNVYQQEVFTVYPTTLSNGKPTLDFSFMLAKSPFNQIVNGKTVQSFLEQECRTVVFSNDFYRTGGKDQMRLQTLTFDVLRVLSHPSFVAAARLHNLRLMRKGTNMNRVSHCMDLAENMLVLG